MPENQLELEIKDFRAIQEARIALNGITVISGENGCGKSTISKLMYYSVKAINEYEEIVYKPLLYFLKKTNNRFTSILDDIKVTFPELKMVTMLPFVEKIPDSYFIANNVHEIINSLNQTAQLLKDIHKSIIDQPVYNDKRIILRFKMTLLTLLQTPIGSSAEWDDIIDHILALIDEKALNTNKAINKKDLRIFNAYIVQLFKDESLYHRFNLYEYNICLTDRVADRLLNINTFNKVLYIDTPMAIGLQGTDIQHWNELNDILEKGQDSTISETLQVTHFLSDEILNGEVGLDKNAIFKQFTYRRKDGLIINLLDCATGIKSFAILQMLLKNGYLDNKTLLIIDEPEAHLHPQWIVEYARIVTLLNKELGVKFLIASHNPDMISALKYISEKEDVSGNLNFYLAEKGEKETYIYKGLGTEIDEIFSSFNIAIDRINQYGAVNDEIF